MTTTTEPFPSHGTETLPGCPALRQAAADGYLEQVMALESGLLVSTYALVGPPRDPLRRRGPKRSLLVLNYCPFCGMPFQDPGPGQTPLPTCSTTEEVTHEHP